MQRLLKWFHANDNKAKYQSEITHFLSPTGKIEGDQAPLVNQYYRDTFSLVDRFNKILSSISYSPRIASDNLRFLYAYVEIAIAQTVVLWEERERMQGNQIPRSCLGAYAKDLAEE